VLVEPGSESFGDAVTSGVVVARCRASRRGRGRGSWYRPTAGLAAPQGSHERTVLLWTLATPHPERKRGSGHGRATTPAPMTAPRSPSPRSQRARSPSGVAHHQPAFRALGDPRAAASTAVEATDLARSIGNAL